jgi:hypothetical protein
MTVGTMASPTSLRRMLGHVLDDLRIVVGICPATGLHVLAPLD